MTYEDKVQYLLGYRRAFDRQYSLLDEIEQWRTMAERVTADLSGMPRGGGGGPNRIESAVEHIDELQRQLEEQVKTCIARRAEVEAVIKDVPNLRQQEILRMVYLNGYAWPEIVARTGYDERYARRLRKRAVACPRQGKFAKRVPVKQIRPQPGVAAESNSR